MKIFSQDLLMSLQHTNAVMVTITIVPKKYEGNSLVPAPSAVVLLTADGYIQSGNTITVPAGVKVHSKVTLTDYNNDEQDIVAYDDTTVEVKLNNRTEYLFTLNLTPSVSYTLVCLDENDVPTGRTSTTGSMYVPSNYKVRVDLQNPDQFNTPVSEYTWTVTDTTVITKTLKATVSFGDIYPVDSNHEFSIEDNQFASPIYDNSVETQCTNRVYWRVNKPGYIEQSGTVNSSGAPNYFTNQTLSSISLQKKPLTYTVNVSSPVGAVISITVLSASTGTSMTYISTDSSYSVTCYIGDQISYSVSKTGYETQESMSPTTMQSEDMLVSGIRLTPLVCAVQINALPTGSSVTLTDITDNQTYTGTGTVEQDIMIGHQITYTATYGGSTTSGGPHTITESDVENGFVDWLYPVALDTSVTLITASQTVSLQPGLYKFVLIGGGGGGCRNANPGYASGDARNGANGGGGGGSGYIKISNVSITNSSGASATVTIGDGGGVNANGGTTSVVIANEVNISAEGGTSGYNSSASQQLNEATKYVMGGDGGSGGGSGGIGGKKGNYTADGTNGGNGANGGGNGQTVTQVYGSATITRKSGIGAYNAEKGYENNAGAATAYNVNGNPGGGGRGLVGISSSLLQPSYFVSLTNIQTLYNAIGGGGGGGATNAVPTFQTPVPADIFGGPGGGGGGWFSGTAGTSGNSGGVPGSGGAGAVLYMRISWS